MSFGFSISDIILLADKANDIHKSINDKQENAPRQLRLLGEQFGRFGKRLRELCRTLEQYESPRYDGYAAFKRTLDECQDFVSRFGALNDPGANAVHRWLRSGKYTFENERIKQLQLQADSHVQDIIVFQNNLTLATVSELLKRNKEKDGAAEATSTTVELSGEIDDLAANIEAILARTLLSPSLQDVTDGRVEMHGGALERTEYRQKRTSNAVLQQLRQPGGQPDASSLPELHGRSSAGDLTSSVAADDALRVHGSVSRLMDRLAFTRQNSRDEAGLHELSGIAVEAQQLLSRARNSQKRTAIPSIRSHLHENIHELPTHEEEPEPGPAAHELVAPAMERISSDRSNRSNRSDRSDGRPELPSSGSSQSPRMSIDGRSVFSVRTVDTALTVPTPRLAPAARATTNFSSGSGSPIPEPAVTTLLSAVPAKFRASDMKGRPMDCGVDVCSDGFNLSLTISLSNGVKYVEYLQDAPIPHVEHPDADDPPVLSVSFPGSRSVYRESPQTPAQRIEVNAEYFFGSKRHYYEFQEKIYDKKLLQCIGVDSVKLDGKKLCEMQRLRIWMGRDGIRTAMFFANSQKEKERLYLEYKIISAEPVNLDRKTPVRLHVAAELETGGRKPSMPQRRSSSTSVLSTASKKSTFSIRRTSRSELTLDVVVTATKDRQALKSALEDGPSTK
ncbi:MAG: hypothetical protein M1832_003649 [Thelocarpon impressellum]|nr:MAG: hypothetical protein M1832_003649 [Thelocarpon impressellum]